ncbi:MAG: protoporphyrinogen oxidase [Oligoflexia bacterium]|nr:protoporphyrinogen oxidase [Oligoflexia bacterium]
MLGRIDPGQKEVTVVGAGIAGLLAAYELDRKGYEVTLVEAAPRAGGLIQTERTPFGIAESAAHSILVTPVIERLCEELGVELVPVRKESKSRFILRDGKLRKFPLSFFEAVWAFLRAYFVLSPKEPAPECMTFQGWAERFFGKPVARYLMTPFLRGIYGANPADLAVSAVYPALVVPRGHSFLSWMLRRAFRKGGSPGKAAPKPKRRLRGMVTPRGGMQSLVDALDARLVKSLGARYRKGQPLAELPASGNIVLSVPAPAAARLLERESPELSRALSAVRYTALAAVTAFVPRETAPSLPRGVGVLFPDGEGRDSLGILFNSSSFPARVTDEGKWASFTLIIGGTPRPELVGRDDGALEEIVRNELRTVLGAPEVSRMVIRRWEQAVPRYDFDLQRAWQVARETWCSQPGRVLFGNYTGQISLRGMIESASGLAAGLHS